MQARKQPQFLGPGNFFYGGEQIFWGAAAYVSVHIVE